MASPLQICLDIPTEGCDLIAAAINEAMKKPPLLAIPLKYSNSGSSHAVWKAELEGGGSHPSS